MRNFALLLFVVVLAALAAFVWPTRYRYERSVIEQAPTQVRHDRFTGKAERLTEYGWLPLAARPAAAPLKAVSCEEAQEAYRRNGRLAISFVATPEDCDLSEAKAEYECSEYRSSARSRPSKLKYSDPPLGCDVRDLIAEYRRAGGYR